MPNFVPMEMQVGPHPSFSVFVMLTRIRGLIRNPPDLPCLRNSDMHPLCLPISSSGAYLWPHPSLTRRSTRRRQADLEGRGETFRGKTEGGGDLDCYGRAYCICG